MTTTIYSLTPPDRRPAALAAPGVGLVHGTFGVPVETLRVWLDDRRADGDAFPGEFVVRLPRRYGRRTR